MTAKQVIQEALDRLKRSGEQHIFLSDQSRVQLKSWTETASDSQATSNLTDSLQSEERAVQKKALSEGEGTTETKPSFLLTLPNSGKADQMIALKESYQSFSPNEKLLFGQGSLEAQLLFLSEYPSADEFSRNTFYTGEVLKLMEKIFTAMGVVSSELYFSSLIKSQPLALKWMQNPDQASEGLTHSLEYLKHELAIVQPRVIVLLGASAYNTLFKDGSQKMPFETAQGQQLSYRGIHLIPAVHPHYLLLKNTLESKYTFWQSMLTAMDLLKLPINEAQRNYFKKS
ncbi:MAG: hypothetical protein CML08_01940 [Puniceicoccaceae bacterium]|nr:hypothetical protein [Puniceicoccaceae bacterium]